MALRGHGVLDLGVVGHVLDADDDAKLGVEVPSLTNRSDGGIVDGFGVVDGR